MMLHTFRVHMHLITISSGVCLSLSKVDGCRQHVDGGCVLWVAVVDWCRLLLITGEVVECC